VRNNKNKNSCGKIAKNAESAETRSREMYRLWEVQNQVGQSKMQG